MNKDQFYAEAASLTEIFRAFDADVVNLSLTELQTTVATLQDRISTLEGEVDAFVLDRFGDPEPEFEPDFEPDYPEFDPGKACGCPDCNPEPEPEPEPDEEAARISLLRVGLNTLLELTEDTVQDDVRFAAADILIGIGLG